MNALSLLVTHVRVFQIKHKKQTDHQREDNYIYIYIYTCIMSVLRRALFLT